MGVNLKNMVAPAVLGGIASGLGSAISGIASGFGTYRAASGFGKELTKCSKELTSAVDRLADKGLQAADLASKRAVTGLIEGVTSMNANLTDNTEKFVEEMDKALDKALKQGDLWVTSVTLEITKAIDHQSSEWQQESKLWRDQVKHIAETSENAAVKVAIWVCMSMLAAGMMISIPIWLTNDGKLNVLNVLFSLFNMVQTAVLSVCNIQLNFLSLAAFGVAVKLVHACVVMLMCQIEDHKLRQIKHAVMITQVTQMTAEVTRLTAKVTELSTAHSDLEHTLTASIQGYNVTVGTILLFSGSSDHLPDKFKICDGARLSRTDYPQLFEVIGHAYSTAGGNDESDVFYLPDLRGKVPLSSTPSGLLNISARNIGDSGGEEMHQLTFAEMPRHQHGIQQEFKINKIKKPFQPLAFSKGGSGLFSPPRSTEEISAQQDQGATQTTDNGN